MSAAPDGENAQDGFDFFFSVFSAMQASHSVSFSANVYCFLHL